MAPNHILVIPKKHIDSIGELEENDTLLAGKLVFAAKKIAELKNYSLPYSNGFIKEFIIKTTNPASKVIHHCADNGFIISGVNGDASNSLLLIAITEKRTQEEIDLLVQCLGEFD